ncbi:hypothetical protein FQN57_000765 [Myotisia sp. PD_48]|nr:hypothetical protein FQN57_000765 [Myotisia sp. PD_48]
MPRTLPWKTDLRDSSTPRSSRASSRPERTSRVATPGEKHYRSPSTSPAREPPSEEFMVEGLDGDDQYIMVEDEFLATAQTFTRHLHYAEYLRRKTEAKSQNAKTILRPTDPRTPMSNETRKSIQDEMASLKRQEKLNAVKKDTGRPRVDSESEDNNENTTRGSEYDREDDPWVGTQLQPLMGAARPHRSLIGLHRVQSSTKAALGYQANPAPRSPVKRAIGVEDGGREISAPRSNIYHDTVDITTSGEDDDDLAAHPTPKLEPNTPKVKIEDHYKEKPTPWDDRRATRKQYMNTSLQKKPMSAKASTSSGSTRSRHDLGSPNSYAPATASSNMQTSKSRFADFFDDFDEPGFSSSMTPVKESRERLGITNLQNKVYKKPRTVEIYDANDKTRKKRLNEVPTFL